MGMVSPREGRPRRLRCSKADSVAFDRTFVVSYALMFLINLIPGCKFRVDEEGEIIGVDEVEVRFRYPAIRACTDG